MLLQKLLALHEEEKQSTSHAEIVEFLDGIEDYEPGDDEGDLSVKIASKGVVLTKSYQDHAVIILWSDKKDLMVLLLSLVKIGMIATAEDIMISARRHGVDHTEFAAIEKSIKGKR